MLRSAHGCYRARCPAAVHVVAIPSASGLPSQLSAAAFGCSQVLRPHPTSRQRTWRYDGLSLHRPSVAGFPAWELPGSPGFRAWNFWACSGSPTPPGLPMTRAIVIGHVAFPFCQQGRPPGTLMSVLNGWPARAAVNASPATSRAACAGCWVAPADASLADIVVRYSFRCWGLAPLVPRRLLPALCMITGSALGSTCRPARPERSLRLRFRVSNARITVCTKSLFRGQMEGVTSRPYSRSVSFHG